MRIRAPRLSLAVGAAVLCLFAGCGKQEEPPAPAPVAAGVAARINGEVISFDQVRDIDGAQGADEVNPVVVDRLVDMTLLAQAARSLGLDKDPEVARRLDASARVILARAYLERATADVASAPSADEVRNYYDKHPELFAQRRIFQLREVSTAWPVSGAEELKRSLQSARGALEVDRQLAAKGLQFSERQLMEPAERLPLSAVKQIAQLAPGRSIVLVDAEAAVGRPGRARVLTLVSSRSMPRTMAEASPAIEAFLLNEKRRTAGREHVAELRARAQVVKYAGDPPVGSTYARQPSAR